MTVLAPGLVVVVWVPVPHFFGQQRHLRLAWCSHVWVALRKKKSESDGGTPTIVCSRDVAPRSFVQHVHALEMESWMREECAMILLPLLRCECSAVQAVQVQ